MIGTPMSGKDIQVRGWLALTNLPDDVQAAEDATAAADIEKARDRRGLTFTRPATDTERRLLADHGHVVPDELTTYVHYRYSIRHRSWPAIEEQENRA